MLKSSNGFYFIVLSNFIFLNCLIPARVNGDKITANDVISQLRSKWNRPDSFKLDILTTSETMGMTTVVKGKIYGKNRKIRIESEISNEKIKKTKYVTIYDGEATWTYDHKSKVITKLENSKLPEVFRKDNLLSNAFQLPAGINFVLEEKSLANDKLFILKSSEPIKLVRGMEGVVEIWINAENFEIKKTGWYGKQNMNGKEIEVNTISEYSGYEYNKYLPDKLFIFKIPKNAVVKDMTQVILKQLNIR